jgi:hypothetical protein
LKVVWATLRWLREEGFIRARGDAATEDVVLTAAALDAMNKAPAGLGPSVGAKLTDAAKNVGSEAGKSAMSGAVGELVGGFVKGLFT